MCEHEIILDALKKVDTDHYGVLYSPVKVCLECHDIVLEMPE